MMTSRCWIGLAFGSAMMLGCASAPQSPPGSDLVRDKLARLQADPVLANKAPDPLDRAEMAVRLAEQPLGESAAEQALGTHRVYLADRKVEIAMAKAATRHAEDQRGDFAEQRATARLDARTREADLAQVAADRARRDAEGARGDADRMARARADERADSAAAADRSAREAAQLRRQIETLEAEATERGLVLTLGDLLFAFDSADLRSGLSSNLDRVATFLENYPARHAVIEGHTDNVGDAVYNRRLSQRRADAVRQYLMDRGVAPERLSASGFGHTQPLVDNSSDSGRQRNRRVEIIIDNPPPASVSRSMQ